MFSSLMETKTISLVSENVNAGIYCQQVYEVRTLIVYVYYISVQLLY